MSSEKHIKKWLIQAINLTDDAFSESELIHYPSVHLDRGAFLGPIVVKVYEELKKLEKGE